MEKRINGAEQIDEVKVSSKEKLVIWKAQRPMTHDEHEQLSQKIRFEQEKSGVKILFVPYTVEAEMSEQAKGKKGSKGVVEGD